MHYSKRSAHNLETCHSKIQETLRYILFTLKYDHTVICGHRKQIDQQIAFVSGASKIDWPNSKHNLLPSMAVDVVPYMKVRGLRGGIHWRKDLIIAQGKTEKEANKVVDLYLREMVRFATTVQIIGLERFKIELRSGMDWDKDWNLMDNVFNDYLHLEIVKTL